MEKEDNQDNGRKPYETPKLRVIELAAEEVLVAGCKTSPVSSGPGSPSCLSASCSTTLGS